MTTILALIQPWDPIQQARVDIRVYSGLNSIASCYGNLNWQNALFRRPRLAQELMDDDITGQLMTGRGDMVLDVNLIEGIPNLHDLIWDGAPVTIWSGSGNNAADFTVEFLGSSVSGVEDRESGQVPMNLRVDQKLLEVPLLSEEFTGGGGADGDPETAGTLRPAGFGSPKNVPVNFFDTTNFVGQIDGYGNTISIDALFEDLADFGPSHGDYATYAALVAADIPEGTWATCIQEGLIRLGAPPAGVITCDPVFMAATPGDMALRWMEMAGITAGRIDDEDFAALDALADFICGETCTVSFWTDQQVRVLDLLQRLCASCNSMPLLKLNGQIGVTYAFSNDAPALTLDRQGGDRLVTNWQSLDPTVPWWRLKMVAARVYRVHTPAEIDYDDEIVLRGDYDDTETYRRGHVVRQPLDGRLYLYTNAEPGVGIDPPEVGWWDIYEEAPDASVVKYVDGTPIEDLKPSAPGATRNFNRGAWAAGVDYDVGDFFEYQGTSYSVITAHTSSGGSPPPNANVSILAAQGEDGDPGAAAITITMLSDRQTIYFDGAGVATPSVQTTNFIAKKQNTTATVTWSVTDANGTPRTPASSYLSASTGDAVNMTLAQFESARNGTSGVIVTCSIAVPGTIADSISVTRVSSGAQGAAAKSLAITQSRFNIVLSPSGSPDPATQDTAFTAVKQNTTATVTWSVADGNGTARTPATLYLSSATGDTVTMTVTQFIAAANGTGSITVTGTLTDGTTITAKASLAQVRIGDPGKTVAVIPSLSSFRYDEAGMAVPSGQIITFTAVKNQTSGTVTWTVHDASGTLRTPVTNFLSAATGDTVTMTEAQFALARGSTMGVRVTATIVDGSQTIVNTYPITYDLVAGGIHGVLTMRSFTFAADPFGVLKAGQLAKGAGNMRVFSGGTEVTTGKGVVYSVAGTPTGCTATINSSTGAWSLLSVTQVTGSVTFRAVYGGVTVEDTFTFSTTLAPLNLLSGWLSNSEDQVQVAADYSGGSLTGLGGTFRLFNGDVNITTGNGVVYSVVSTSAGLTMSINSSTGVYAPTALTVNSGTAMLRATYGTLTYDLEYRIIKVPAGNAAKLLVLTAGPEYFRYGATGIPDPAVQVVTFWVNRPNIFGTVSWSMTDLEGDPLPAGTYLTSGGTVGPYDTIQLTAANFNAAITAGASKGVRVTAAITDGAVTYSDSQTITYIGEGATGAPARGTYVSGTRRTVAYDPYGNVFPVSQTTSMTLVRQNFIGGTVTWSVTDGLGNPKTPVTNFLSAATGDTVTMSAAQFSSARGNSQVARITASVTNGSDTFTASWEISAIRPPVSSDNQWPDRQFNTLDQDWEVPIAAPFSFITNGDTLGSKFKNYLRIASSSAGEFTQKVISKIPVSAAGEWWYWGFAGGRVGGSGSCGLYAIFRDINGNQVGTRQTLYFDSALTLSGDWPMYNHKFQTPNGGATYLEIGFIKRPFPDFASGLYYIANPYIQRSQPNSNNTEEYQAKLEVPTDQIVYVTYQGSPINGQFPRALQARRFQGEVDVTNQTTWSMVESHLCTFDTPAISATGAINMTSSTGPGYFIVQGIYNNVIMRRRVEVDWSFDFLPQGVEDNVVSDQIGTTSVTATSFNTAAPIIGPIKVSTKAVGQLTFFLRLVVQILSGAGYVEVGAYYRAVGSGTWIFAGVIWSSTTTLVFDPNQPKFGTGGATLIKGTGDGLFPNTDYEVIWVARKVGTAPAVIMLPGLNWVRGK